MSELYIGLMSGTSVDGIDAVLVDFSQTQPKVLATHYLPYSQTLRDQILSLCQKGENEIQRLGELDIILGKEFARAANNLLIHRSLKPNEIKAIGSHGQTIRHFPNHPQRFTMQIGDPNSIAAATGITTISDFRRKDMAFGGQGAPLVPAFHQYVFASTNADRAIINIGGIANVTILAKNQNGHVIGFDTGPGNTLLDGWMHHHHKKTHDQNGDWGSQGKVQEDLLKRCLEDKYFQLPPPKSTGREHFNMSWVQKHLHGLTIHPTDVQATLTELTAATIAQAVQSHLSQGEMLVCGGGAHNTFLMQRLKALANTKFSVSTTEKYGLDPDWVEAIAFAWLAKQTLHRQPGNLPSVTGAKQAVVLGGVYYC